MQSLTIGQLAAQACVNVQTIRYYERCGLLADPNRTESGYRIYLPEMIQQVQFIKQAQKLGFTLREIAVLLTLSVHSTDVCQDVRQRAESKIQEIDTKISAFYVIRQALQQLITACNERQLTKTCPLLDALQNDRGEDR
jgi:Hg(II)-responsive transcriptional regulator